MNHNIRTTSLFLCLILLLLCCACSPADTPDILPTEGSDTAAATVPDTEAEAPTETEVPAPDFTFTVFSPAEGSEHILIPADLYAWYAAYTSEAAYYSSLNVTDRLANACSVPVRLTWAGEGNAVGYTLRYGLTADLSGADTVTIETTETEVDVDCLYVASVYHWQVTAHTPDGDVTDAIHSFRTAETVRLMHVEGLNNARDIGGRMTDFGVRMKQGVCYRSSILSSATRQALKALSEEYGIVTDLDLRAEDEVKAERVEVRGLNFINAPGENYLDAIYEPEKLCAELRPFADPANYPIIFHCVAGRDRTGTLAILLEALCGMSEVDIVRDYEETFLLTSDNKRVPDEPCTTSLNSFVLPFIASLRNGYGKDVPLYVSAERCLLTIGMTPEEITAIRRNLLDDAWVPTEIATEWEMPSWERAPEQDDPVVAFDAEQLLEAYNSYSGSTHVQSAELHDDYLTFTIDKDGEMGVYIVREPMRLASVVLIRYRVTTAKSRGVYMETFIDSEHSGASAGSNYAYDVNYDGKWHTIVADLEGNIPSYNGYYAEYCRMDFLNSALAGDTADISFVGFFTSVEAAERYAELFDTED